MKNNPLFYLSDLLYHHMFGVYRILYFFYKKRKDAFELNLLKKIIRPGSIILDIGANIGFYSDVFSQLSGENGKVHCFEPDQANFKHLTKTAGKRSNIVLNNNAVSDKEGKITLYTSFRLNVDHRTYPVEKFKSSYEVETISIDKYVEDKYKVDFIKMDIQGAEFPALKGMEKTLKNNRDIIVFMEIMPSGLRAFGISANTVINYIRSLGFIIYIIKNNTIEIAEEAAMKKYELYKEDEFDNLILSRNNLQDLL